MQENKPVSAVNSEIGIGDLLRICWLQKKLVTAITIVCTVLAFAFTLVLPEYYVADLLAKPVENTDTGPNQSSGGLSALAGGLLNKEIQYGDELVIYATSRKFVLDFIKKNNLEAKVFAVTGLDEATGELEFDADLYDADSQQWVANKAPSSFALYKTFMDEYYNVTYDDQKNLLSFSMQYYDKDMAYDWLVSISNELNDYLMNKRIDVINKRLSYLEGQVGTLRIPAIKNATSELFQNQMYALLMTQYNDGFAFEIIDPAIKPVKPNKSKHLLLIVIGCILGGFLGIFVALYKHVSRNHELSR